MQNTIELIVNFIVFIMGSLFGSFYTLAIYRIPLKKNITKGRSFCPNCKNKLNILDLFPIFSFVFLKGKCRHCKDKIKAKYFFIELFTAMVFLMFFNSLNYFEIENLNELLNKNISMFAFILFYTYMFLTAYIDREKYVIEDNLLTFGIIVSILYVFGTYLLGSNVNYIYMLTSSTSLVLLFIISELVSGYKIRTKYYVKLSMFFVILSIYIPIKTIIIVGIASIPIYLLIYFVKRNKLKKEFSGKTNKNLKENSDETKIKVEIDKNKEHIYIVEKRLLSEKSFAKDKILRLKDLRTKNINEEIHIPFALIIGVISFILYIVLNII